MKVQIIILLLILFSGVASAQSAGQIVVNSADWTDVYSTIIYANLEGIPYHFVISESHAQDLPQYMDKNLDVRVIESDSVPYLTNYKSILEERGYTVVDETRSSGGRKLNLELAGELDINKFIVVDDVYGYNAISAASYAVRSKSWVLFADRDNIDDIYTFLGGRNVESVLIYGRVDKAVKEQLSGFNPEIINEGNRFDDNLAIVTKYMEIAPAEGVILTNGDFIEATIMSGESPVIFIGTDTVPPQVIDYVKNSNISGSTVIGNDLTNSAKRLKDAANISIFIKFGQGRQTSEGMSLVGELDKFYLPRYELTLDAVSARYNEATKQLEVIYRNDAEVGEFIKSSIGVFADEERIATVGDETAWYIDKESDSGSAYDIDLTDYARSSTITAHLSAQFGEAPGSLNLLLTKTLDVSTISVQDKSKIEVSGLVYDTGVQRLKLTIKNTGDMQTYASPAVTLLIDGTEETFRLGNAIPLEAGEKSTASLRAELTKADLADNPKAQVHVAYGERPTLLIKSLDTALPLKVTRGLSTGLIIIGLAGIIILLVIGIWYKRKRMVPAVQCINCGEPMPASADFCPKCGKGASDAGNAKDT